MESANIGDLKRSKETKRTTNLFHNWYQWNLLDKYSHIHSANHHRLHRSDKGCCHIRLCLQCNRSCKAVMSKHDENEAKVVSFIQRSYSNWYMDQVPDKSCWLHNHLKNIKNGHFCFHFISTLISSYVIAKIR